MGSSRSKWFAFIFLWSEDETKERKTAYGGNYLMGSASFLYMMLLLLVQVAELYSKWVRSHSRTRRLGTGKNRGDRERDVF
jgi:hypothetical protein